MREKPVYTRWIASTRCRSCSQQSYQAAEALRDGALVLALEEFAPPPVPVHVVRAGERPLPLKVRAFLDFLVPRLRAALAPGMRVAG